MKKISMYLAYALATLMLLGLSRTVVYADTVHLTLTGAGSAPWGLDYISPYFIKDGNTTTVDVAPMCISFNRTVTIGETRDATSMAAAAADALHTATRCEEAAYFLPLAVAGINPLDDQLAAWWLFEPSNDPTYQSLKSEMTPGAWYLVNYPPSNSVLNQYRNHSVFFVLDGATDYDPAQDFVGLTPEPDIWVLLGSGMIGMVVLVYFRRRSAVCICELGF